MKKMYLSQVIYMLMLIMTSCKNPWMQKILTPFFENDGKSGMEEIWNEEIWNMEDFGSGVIPIVYTAGVDGTLQNIFNSIGTVPGDYVVHVPPGTHSLTPVSFLTNGVHISLRGEGTIQQTAIDSASLVWVDGPDSILILRGPTIKGLSNNQASLVSVGGIFIMYSGTLTGNEKIFGDRAGGGVFIGTYGSFYMKGGTISSNTANMGGGVYSMALAGGIFEKTGGTIYGSGAGTLSNTASLGAAVCYDSGAQAWNTTLGPGNNITVP